jgi:hypothetical protein
MGNLCGIARKKFHVKTTCWLTWYSIFLSLSYLGHIAHK